MVALVKFFSRSVRAFAAGARPILPLLWRWYPLPSLGGWPGLSLCHPLAQEVS